MGTVKHGRYGTFEYNVWAAMKKRCNYAKHPRYHLYGGRGIKVCERWATFANFFADMGECPFEHGSIERKDNNKGYAPGNCVWIPNAEQSKNRRCVTLVAGDPVEVAAKKHGIAASTLRQRLRNNWPEHLLLKTPQQIGTRS